MDHRPPLSYRFTESIFMGSPTYTVFNDHWSDIRHSLSHFGILSWKQTAFSASEALEDGSGRFLCWANTDFG